MGNTICRYIPIPYLCPKASGINQRNQTRNNNAVKFLRKQATKFENLTEEQKTDALRLFSNRVLPGQTRRKQKRIQSPYPTLHKNLSRSPTSSRASSRPARQTSVKPERPIHPVNTHGRSLSKKNSRKLSQKHPRSQSRKPFR